MATKAQALAFIKQIAPLIQKEAKARGYKVCSPIIAQACKESGFNTSGLSKKYNNYFGLKAGSTWKGARVKLKTKEEYKKGILTEIYDYFRCFADMVEGVKGYFYFISSKRYANLKSAATPLEFLNRIKEDGYCTSSTYVESCMNHYIIPYDLTKFDTYLADSEEVNINPYEVPKRTLRRGDKGEDVKWLQYQLQKAGLNVGAIDGIFGQKTYSGVTIFQKNQDGRIAIDGIVGKQTLAVLQKLG